MKTVNLQLSFRHERVPLPQLGGGGRALRMLGGTTSTADMIRSGIYANMMGD